MIAAKFVLYFLLVLMFLIDVWLLIMNIEYWVCAFIWHQPPYVGSNMKLRRAVVNELKQHYPNAQKICEIGAGYGVLARQISKDAARDVLALENMPFSAFICWLRGCRWRGRYRTKWCDAIDFLKHTDMHFDVAVAYMGPTFTPRLNDCKKCFDVLVSLDFELPGGRPVRVVDGIRGHTVYNGKKYPHRLFIYEFKHKKQKEKK